MAPILYMIDASPPANAVRMFADIIGLDLELKRLDMTVAEHKSPEYLKINPIGSIPALKDGDFVVSDSHVIMKYLLSKIKAAQNIYKCRYVKDLGGDLLCKDLAVKKKEVQPPDLPLNQGRVAPVVTPADVQTALCRSRNRKVVGAD
ncbi:unnamed protein product [Arctia plantaginis]|uniref:GST N-terminal domain-containing protein n=1 Tax=Arctia plantaginis TaxID=874455 RepID=A0A8S1A417_ARCPL|nr:unnamed protein product [Arctia plantaginis]